MRGSSRAGLAVLALAVLWIVVYWRTERATPIAAAGEVVQLNTQMEQGAIDPLASVEAAPRPRGMSPETPSGGITAEPAVAVGLPASAVLPAPAPAPVIEPPQAPKKEAPSSGVVPPTFDLYSVVAGDTAAAISQKKFGTSKHWRAVLRANPLLDFTRLKPGQVIRVPHDPSNVQGTAVARGPDHFAEYVVTDGDTLMGIATALYGKASMWQDIRDANNGLIDEEGTNLRPGMKLKVPPPPSSAGGR